MLIAGLHCLLACWTSFYAVKSKEMTVTEPPAVFSQQLRTLREAQGLSIRALADRVGVSKVTIWKWERGDSEPRLHLIPPLAEALRVTPASLRPNASSPEQLPHDTTRSDQSRQIDTLADVIARAKREIAEASGVGEKNITISIDY